MVASMDRDSTGYTCGSPIGYAGRYVKCDRDRREVSAELSGRKARFPATGIKVENARCEALALAGAVAGVPGAVAAAAEEGLAETVQNLAGAIQAGTSCPAPPPDAVHSRATLASIADAARKATARQHGRYRISKKPLNK